MLFRSATSHFYWIGAIPAMVFVGVFMMPFYYGSRARSVPEYLKLRFDEKTRGFNAITFAAMTVFSSGISLYAMGLLLGVLLGWDFTFSVMISALIVLAYISLGGLTSAISSTRFVRASLRPRHTRRRAVQAVSRRFSSASRMRSRPYSNASAKS